jgi:hypothetical protein
MEMMFAQDVTNILAKKTFNALSKFLNPIDVALSHPPRAIRGIRRSWFEFFDFLLHPIVDGHIGYEVPDHWKCLHRMNGYRLVRWHITHARHAHQLWAAIDFGGTGTALTGFTIPAYSHVIGLLGLNLVDGIQHDHSFGNISFVFLKLSSVSMRTPDFKGHMGHKHYILVVRYYLKEYRIISSH